MSLIKYWNLRTKFKNIVTFSISFWYWKNSRNYLGETSNHLKSRIRTSLLSLHCRITGVPFFGKIPSKKKKNHLFLVCCFPQKRGATRHFIINRRIYQQKNADKSAFPRLSGHPDTAWQTHTWWVTALGTVSLARPPLRLRPIVRTYIIPSSRLRIAVNVCLNYMRFSSYTAGIYIFSPE